VAVITQKLLTLHKLLPIDSVSMSVGHLDHVFLIYSLMEHVTWKSPRSCPAAHRSSSFSL